MGSDNPGVTTAGTMVVTAVAAASGVTALVRVPAGAPAATLVSELGAPVGVPVVSNLLREDGTPIPPGSTLQAAGVGDGARVLVVGNRDRHQAGPAAIKGSAPPMAAARPAPTNAPIPTNAPTPPPPISPAPGPTPTPTSTANPVARPVPSAPDQSGAGQAGPGQAGPGQTGPGQAAPGQAAPGQTGPGQAAPGQAGAGQFAPGQPGEAHDGTGKIGAARDGATPDGATQLLAPTGPPTPARPEALSGRTIGGLPVETGQGPGRRLLLGGGAVVVAAILVVVGLVIGRATTSTPTPVTTSPPAATAVAAAWANAAAYTGPLLPGVPADLGRSGRLTGVIEPVGFRSAGSVESTWFVVVPTSGQAFGLSVQLVGGSLAVPPSISPLPFGAGALPPGTGTRLSPPATPSKVISSWVAQTFGPQDPLLTSPGVGLTGTPGGGGMAAQGRGTVMQVKLELSSRATGTPATAAAGAVTSAQAALKAANAAVTADSASLAQANATNAAAQQAYAAAAAAGAANPAAVPAVAPAQAAANAGTAAVTAAQTQLTADQAKQQAAQAALKAAQAKVPAPLTTEGTYDVWVTNGKVTGWVPTGYQGG